MEKCGHIAAGGYGSTNESINIIFKKLGWDLLPDSEHVKRSTATRKIQNLKWSAAVEAGIRLKHTKEYKKMWADAEQKYAQGAALDESEAEEEEEIDDGDVPTVGTGAQGANSSSSKESASNDNNFGSAGPSGKENEPIQIVDMVDFDTSDMPRFPMQTPLGNEDDEGFGLKIETQEPKVNAVDISGGDTPKSHSSYISNVSFGQGVRDQTELTPFGEPEHEKELIWQFIRAVVGYVCWVLKWLGNVAIKHPKVVVCVSVMAYIIYSVHRMYNWMVHGQVDKTTNAAPEVVTGSASWSFMLTLVMCIGTGVMTWVATKSGSRGNSESVGRSRARQTSIVPPSTPPPTLPPILPPAAANTASTAATPTTSAATVVGSGHTGAQHQHGTAQGAATGNARPDQTAMSSMAVMGTAMMQSVATQNKLVEGLLAGQSKAEANG